jgi:hypothetical protein
MKPFLTFLVVLTSTVGQGANQDVKHAPTAEQCQADQRLWLSRLEAGNSSKLPDITIISKWNREMSDCETVDPNNKGKYSNTGAEIDAEEVGRMTDFLARHDLWAQFQTEDTAGQR